MFRVLARELALSLGALAALAAAAFAVAQGFGAPVLPDGHMLWLEVFGGPSRWVSNLSAIGTAIRLVCFVLLTLLAALVVLRIIVAGLLLLRLDYAFLAHLGVALRLPVVRRAGATAVMGLLIAPGGSIASGLPTFRRAIVASMRITALRRPADGGGDAATPQPRARVRQARTVLKRAGLALRYTVQPGDTLSLIAERLCGDAGRYKAIFRASSFVKQPDGRRLINPNLIYPGWSLLVPLRVVTSLSVTEDHVIYVVRPGDSLSAIAARFLGDWRRYPELQPEGATITNDNLIYPGLVLRLPANAVVTPYLAPARLHHIKPRPAAVQRTPQHPTTPRPHVPVTAQHKKRTHSPPAPMPTRRPHSHSREKHPPRGLGRHTTRMGRHIVVHPRRHLHAKQRQRSRPPMPTTTPSATAIPPLTPVPTFVAHGSRPPVPGRTHTSRRRSAPRNPVSYVRVPDTNRTWPLALLLIFAPVFALAAVKRRQIAAGARAIPSYVGTRLAASMRKAIEAVRGGMKGHLAKAVAAGAGIGEINVVAHVCAALEDAGVAAGLAVSLAGSIRTVTETTEMLMLVLDSRQLADDSLTTVVAAIGAALGIAVQSERVIQADGTPSSSLTLKRAPLVALLREKNPDVAPTNPAPLLIPVGQAKENKVVYVNLGQVGPILIAGGVRGTNTLVATLLASVVAQAEPARLRLLVSSNDDEVRSMLPALEHLEAPPVDAHDISAAARIVAQAHQVVLDRFTAGEEGSDEPAYLVILDNVEELRADPRTLDSLDTLCRNSRICGVHVVATTSDIIPLAEAGMVEPFHTRLSRPLTSEESALLFGDNGAEMLAPDEIALKIGATGEVTRLTPFTLTIPEVREVMATVAVALAHDMPGHVETAARYGSLCSDKGSGAAPDLAAQPSSQAEIGPSPSSLASLDTQTVVSPVASGHVANTGKDSPPQVDGESKTDSGATLLENNTATRTYGSSPAINAGLPANIPVDAGDRAILDRGLERPQDADIMPPVELRVLGGITVLAHGGPVVIQPREQRLLAALAIMGPAPVRPDRLVEALFPDDDALTGQDKLQHSITDIRLELKKASVPVKRAGVVCYTEAGYRLDDTLVRVDAYLFRDLLRQCETLDVAQRRPLLAQAVELYRGDLCGDQMLEWVEGYRYAWRKEYLEALYELALYHEQDEKDILGALRMARRLAAEEPLHDHYHQMVLELIGATDDIDALNRYYDEMRSVFEGYDTDIDSYTQTLYERLHTQLTRERKASDNTSIEAS